MHFTAARSTHHHRQILSASAVFCRCNRGRDAQLISDGSFIRLDVRWTSVFYCSVANDTRHAGPQRCVDANDLVLWSRGVREGLFLFPFPPIPTKPFPFPFSPIPLFPIPIPITVMKFLEISKAKKCIIRHIQNIKTYINQRRSDGGGISAYIPPKSVYLKFFYVLVLSP